MSLAKKFKVDNDGNILSGVTRDLDASSDIGSGLRVKSKKKGVPAVIISKRGKIKGAASKARVRGRTTRGFNPTKLTDEQLAKVRALEVQSINIRQRNKKLKEGQAIARNILKKHLEDEEKRQRVTNADIGRLLLPKSISKEFTTVELSQLAQLIEGLLAKEQRALANRRGVALAREMRKARSEFKDATNHLARLRDDSKLKLKVEAKILDKVGRLARGSLVARPTDSESASHLEELSSEGTKKLHDELERELAKREDEEEFESLDSDNPLFDELTDSDEISDKDIEEEVLERAAREDSKIRADRKALSELEDAGETAEGDIEGEEKDIGEKVKETIEDVAEGDVEETAEEKGKEKTDASRSLADPAFRFDNLADLDTEQIKDLYKDRLLAGYAERIAEANSEKEVEDIKNDLMEDTRILGTPITEEEFGAFFNNIGAYGDKPLSREDFQKVEAFQMDRLNRGVTSLGITKTDTSQNSPSYLVSKFVVPVIKRRIKEGRLIGSTALEDIVADAFRDMRDALKPTGRKKGVEKETIVKKKKIIASSSDEIAELLDSIANPAASISPKAKKLGRKNVKTFKLSKLQSRMVGKGLAEMEEENKQASLEALKPLQQKRLDLLLKMTGMNLDDFEDKTIRYFVAPKPDRLAVTDQIREVALTLSDRPGFFASKKFTPGLKKAVQEIAEGKEEPSMKAAAMEKQTMTREIRRMVKTAFNIAEGGKPELALSIIDSINMEAFSAKKRSEIITYITQFLKA